MEQLIRELIQSVDSLNKFSWSDLISLVSLIGAWITIFFLIKDKVENKRPYLRECKIKCVSKKLTYFLSMIKYKKEVKI